MPALYARGIFAHRGEDGSYDVKALSRKRKAHAPREKGWESQGAPANLNSRSRRPRQTRVN